MGWTKWGWRGVVGLGLVLGLGLIATGAEPAYLSHPPLRPLPKPHDRPKAAGHALYVDAAKGADTNAGDETTPFKTVNHALAQLVPGDTLYLRGGTYYERVYCAVRGTAEQPITIRAYPGELAVIDGGFREFFEAPATCWEPFAGGAPGEYRSTRRHANHRYVLGSFGDSLVGLQVYYYHDDLQGATGAQYVGPGIWYDQQTGYLYARFQPHQAEGVIRGRGDEALKYLPGRGQKLESYAGETDPRKLPLVLAPFNAVPLQLDGAAYVRVQDLVLRGAGHDALILRHARHVECDNLTVYAGCYGIEAWNSGPLKLTNSGIYGSVPPWSKRDETSLRERPWETKGRDLTRLGTHALLIPAMGDEYSVYYFPYNHEWEIAYCEFTDAHDGLYLGDIDGLKFHHNLVQNLQDDGIYLSNFRKIMKPLHGPRLIYQNVITSCLTAFAFGGLGVLGDEPVLVFRNLIDGGHTVSDHGSPPWDSMYWYQNTIIANPVFVFDLRHVKPGQTWQVYNNLALLGKPPAPKEQEGATLAGNFVGDPKFVGPNQLSLQAGSPAIDAGEPLPAAWQDPLRELDQGKPDAGALPAGAPPLKVGRFGRHSF